MKMPSAPRLKKPKLEAPGFLGDLLRDLRDRRLLLPAVALVAGLIAVPMLLARSSDPAPPLAPPAGSANESPTSAAVLAEGEVGVRDYRKRLEQLKSKNPFEQQFPLPDVSESDDVDVTDAGVGGGSATGPTADPVTSASAGDAAVSTPSSSGSSGGGDNSAPKPPRIEPVYLTREIDVLVGPAGGTVERNGVKQLRLLPSNGKPVVAFLGVTQDGKEAVFAVSGDVAAVGGGECVPSSSNCAYVVLGEGDDATFDYTPDGVTYRLKLKRIRSVELKSGDSLTLP
jgi:hypothetical protein